MNARAELLRILQARGVEHHLLTSRGGGWALMVPVLGARVLGAGLDGANAFWVSPHLERCLEGKDWNAGGQRTWLAPELGPRGFFGAAEKDWAVPPALDPGSYRLQDCTPRSVACRSDCRLRASDGSEFQLRIERQVELLDSPGKPPGKAVLLRIRHSLGNTGPEAIPGRAGLWSILQLPCKPEGSLFLPQMPYRLRFGELPSDWVRREAGRLVLRTAPACRWKIGQEPAGPKAMISHRRPAPGGWLHVSMRCPAPAAGLYLDQGDALQAYNSPLSGPEAFCEMEGHAPAAELAPGQLQEQELEIEVRYGS